MFHILEQKAFGYEEVDSCHDSEQVNKAIKKSLNNDKLFYKSEDYLKEASPYQYYLNKIRLMNKILPSNER